MGDRGYWEIAYQIHVDSKPVNVQVIGRSKKDAMLMFDEQWRLTFGDAPKPARRRIKLVEIERVAWGVT